LPLQETLTNVPSSDTNQVCHPHPIIPSEEFLYFPFRRKLKARVAAIETEMLADLLKKRWEELLALTPMPGL
jgi:hypothetical protein